MHPAVTVHGYRYSVYHRIALMTLLEKGVAYKTVDVDPFSPSLADTYRDMHPFGRVPVLCHGAFQIYETSAITRYVDLAFVGPALTLADAKPAAQMAQCIGIIDSYGYWPMVRQVFANRVFRPAIGQTSDEVEIVRGLESAKTVLAALEKITAVGDVLDGVTMTMADCHLAPMIGYFVQAPEGRTLFEHYPSLNRWWQGVSIRPSFVQTEPGLPDLA